MSKIKQNITRVFVAALWIVSATGLVILLVAAINKKKHATCTGVSILIRNENRHSFIDRQEVLAMIATVDSGRLKSREVAAINLRKMENVIEKNPWVKDAELFFDNSEGLHIQIDEREPMARIFTVGTNSFYIDSSLAQLPLSNRLSLSLPVFTSFPSEKVRKDGPDSALLESIRAMSRFIATDSFWMAQVSQVDITAQGNFEIIPTVGSQVIEFGDASNLAEKFHRLMIFYRNVVPKTGIDKYARILVQYDKQIVAVRKGGIAKYDSLQVLKNIRAMIRASQQEQLDTLSTTVDKNMRSSAKADSPLAVLKPAPVLTNPRPASTSNKKPSVSTSTSALKPKAVMPAKH